MDLKINVTRRDITRGKRRRGNSCPVALAVKRAAREAGFGKKVKTAVSDYVSLYVGGDSYFTRGYKKLGKFTSAFDKGKAVQPFSITLRFKRGSQKL